MTNVTVGSRVVSIGVQAFSNCSRLKSVNCRGNVPELPVIGSSSVFSGSPATIYYLVGSIGWSSTFGGRPAVLWDPLAPFIYTTNDDGIALTITGYTGSNNNVFIPSSINFLPVTSIGAWAFSYNYGLTNVVIPNSVTNIGADAFRFCTSLVGISIPNTINTIQSETFYLCTSLTNVALPNGINNLEFYAFRFCSGLTNVAIPISLTNIQAEAFAAVSS